MSKKLVLVLVMALIFVPTVIAVEPEVSKYPLREAPKDFKDQKKLLMEQRKETQMEYKTKLSEMKDDVMKRKVEKFNKNLDTVRDQRVAAFNNQLKKISESLDRVKIFLDEAKTEGKDTSEADVLLATARQAVSDAQLSVDNLANKDMTLSLSTESAVNSDLQKARSAYAADAQAVVVKIVAARQAAAKAISGSRRLK